MTGDVNFFITNKDINKISHWEDEQLMLYPTQAFFAVFRMSFDGLKEWHCWVLFTFRVNNAQSVELSRFDLVSECIFFIMEKIVSHSALELGMVITALTILAISGNLGVLVILFFMAMTSPQKMSVLRKVGELHGRNGLEVQELKKESFRMTLVLGISKWTQCLHVSPSYIT